MVPEEELDDVARGLEPRRVVQRGPLLLVQTQEGGGVGPEQRLDDVRMGTPAGAAVVQGRPPVGTGVPGRGRVGQRQRVDAGPLGNPGGVVDDGRDGPGIVHRRFGRRRDAGRAVAPQETSRPGEAGPVRVGAGPAMAAVAGPSAASARRGRRGR